MTVKFAFNDIKKILLSITVLNLLHVCGICIVSANNYVPMEDNILISTTIPVNNNLQYASGLKEDVIQMNEEKKISKDYENSKDNVINNIFEELLVGEFKVNELIRYSFDGNGAFSGFYDATHTNVSGYTYNIITENEEAFLYIYNPDKSSAVKYELFLSDTMDVCLMYSELGITIKLGR